MHLFQGDHAHHLIAVGQRHAGQCRHALHQRIGLVRALHLPHAWLGRIHHGLALVGGLFHRALKRTADGREAVKLLHMADGRQAHIGRVHPAERDAIGIETHGQGIAQLKGALQKARLARQLDGQAQDLVEPLCVGLLGQNAHWRGHWCVCLRAAYRRMRRRRAGACAGMAGPLSRHLGRLAGPGQQILHRKNTVVQSDHRQHLSRRRLGQAHGQQLAALRQVLEPGLIVDQTGEHLQQFGRITAPQCGLGRPLGQRLPGLTDSRAEQQHPAGLQVLTHRLKVMLPKDRHRPVELRQLSPAPALHRSALLVVGLA